MERLRYLFLFLVFILASCGPAAQALPTHSPQPPTETIQPSKPTQTFTSIPTDTPTLTATVTPTQTATPDSAATSTADAQATWDFHSEQAKAELEKLGLPTNGELAWFDDESVLFSLEKYSTYAIQPVADERSFINFIMRVEIAWNTTSGLAGCGVVFRMIPPVYKGQAYHFQTLRLSGAPAFSFEYWKLNYREAFLTGDYKYHDAIDVKQDSTNVYTLYVEGNKMVAYANGRKLGQATYTKLSEGQIGVMALQESGDTTCMFDKMWIWELK